MKNRRLAKVLSLILTAVMIIGLLPWSNLSARAEEETSGKWTWTRFPGGNRYETMSMVTNEAFEDGSCDYIVVASGQSFPDALAGAGLAGVYDAPVILTRKDKLSPEAASEITRLAAQRCTILILGGEGTVYPKVVEGIKKLGFSDEDIERVAGSNRDGTAVKVYEKGLEADKGFGDTDMVIIATGSSFADTLSISPYAYAARTPIFLTSNGKLSKTTKALVLNEINPAKVLIVGGALNETAEAEIAEGRQVVKLAGANRYETSAVIMKWELGMMTDAAFQPEVTMTVEGMGIADGRNYPDALGSVSLLGRTASPLLLVANNNKNNKAATLKNIEELVAPNTKNMTHGYIFGGEGSVPAEIEEWLNDAVEVPEEKVYSVDEILEVMKDYENKQVSEELYTVRGVATSSSFNSTYSSYTIWLQSDDGSTAKAFELYSVGMDPGITDDYSASNALKGKTITCVGYLQKYNTTYEMPFLRANVSPTGADFTPTIIKVEDVELTDQEKVNQEATDLVLNPTTFSEATELTLPGPKTYTDVQIAWASDSEYAVVNDGKLVITIPADEDKTANVTATLTLGEATATKTFELTILATPMKVYTVDEILELMKDYTSGQTSEEEYIVKGIATSSSYKSNYNSYDIWLQNDDGSVAQAFQLYSVVLASDIEGDYTAANAFAGKEVTCFGYVKLYNTTYEMPYISATQYSPTVLKVESVEMTDQQKVNQEAADLVLTPTTFSEATELDLPVAKTYTDVQIAWASDSEYAVVNEGKLVITIPAEDATANVTATLTLGEASATKTFELTILATPETVYTVDEILAIMAEYEDNQVSENEYTVTGFATSSSYDSRYGSYTVWLQNNDGSVAQAFELYSAQLSSDITGDYTAANAMAMKNVTCKGFLKKYVKNDAVTYEMAYISSTGASPLILKIEDAELTDQQKVDAEAADLALTPTTFSEATELDLPVAKTYTDVQIAWASDSEYAVVNEGKLVITIPAEDVTAIVTATLTLGEASAQKTFELSILATPETVYTVDEILAIMAEYEDNQVSESEYTVMGFATSSSYDSRYGSYTVWLQSDDGSVEQAFELYSAQLSSDITGDYTAANAMAMKNVTCKGFLKKYVKNNAVTYEMAYISSTGASPLILKIEDAELTDQQKVDYEAALLSLPETVTTEDPITLPVAETYTDVQIAWACDSDLAIFGDDGTLSFLLPQDDTTVHVTATLTLGEASKEVVFTILVVAPSTGSYTWTKVEWADITADDVIAVTMTKGEVTYILSNVLFATSSAPSASETVTINGNTIETTDKVKYGWIREEAEGGYTLRMAYLADQYFYIEDTNNGVRVGKQADAGTKAVIVLDASNYLKSAQYERYVGIYAQQDWRSYNAPTHTNIKNQTLGLWKLGSGEPPVGKTDQEKVDEEAAALTLPAEIDEETVLDLPAAATYTEVQIAWASDSEYAVVSEDGTKLAVTLPAEDVTANVTATISLNDAHVEKNFAILIKAPAAPVIYETVQEILEALYALGNGEVLSGGYLYELEGKITTVNKAYSGGKITVTIVMEGFDDYPVQCYNLTAEEDNAEMLAALEVLKKDDTIKVKGALKNYNGTREFDAGCVLLAYTAAPEAEDVTWTKVNWSAITAEDTIAITVTKDGKTYILPSSPSTSNPAATVVAVADGVMTTKGEEGFGWNRETVEGGFKFLSAGSTDKYLYSAASGTGVRVGTLPDGVDGIFVLEAVSDVDYLKATKTNRYLGVYNLTDWRAYTTSNLSNISGQTLEFWKLGGGEEPPVGPTDQEKVDEAAAALELDEGPFAESTEVLLPVPADESITVTWTSSNPEAFNVSDGVKMIITQSAEEEEAVITATLTLGEATATATFHPVVKAAEPEGYYAFVTEITDGVSYKLGLKKYNEPEPKVYYFTGELSGSYLKTSEDAADAVDLTVEETRDGYFISFVGANDATVYLAVDASGSKPGFVLANEKPEKGFGFDIVFNALSYNDDEKGLFIAGTYGSYTTISFSSAETYWNEFTVDDTQFPARFYEYLTLDEEPTAAEYLAEEKQALELPQTIFTEAAEIDLPEITGVTIAWTTNSEYATVSGNKLVITIPESEDANVNLDASLSYNGASAAKRFALTIKAPAADNVVTFVPSEKYTADTDMTTEPVTIGDITFTFNKGTGSNPPKYYTNGTAIRMYKNNYFTVSAANGKKVQKVVLTFATANYAGAGSVDSGTYTVDGTEGTWEGDAESVTITNAPSDNSQMRIVKIVVTFGE